jgi:hypothetical protein
VSPSAHLLVVLAAAQGPSAPGEAASLAQPAEVVAMRAYVHCDGFAGGVRGVTLDRRPADAPPWREVGFGAKTERVSVVDGYRVMYSYPRTYWFANLKAERSDASRYGEDKRIVKENFVALASADDNTVLTSFSDRGFEGQTLTKKELGGSTLAITQILSDEDAVIVTIYFMNQVPENRAFQTYEEFITLRDGFVRGYIECVTGKRAASGPEAR